MCPNMNYILIFCKEIYSGGVGRGAEGGVGQRLPPDIHFFVSLGSRRFMSLQSILMNLRRFTRFGIINWTMHVIFLFIWKYENCWYSVTSLKGLLFCHHHPVVVDLPNYSIPISLIYQQVLAIMYKEGAVYILRNILSYNLFSVHWNKIQLNNFFIFFAFFRLRRAENRNY